MTLAYIVRHGGTNAPGPEWLGDWPLNALGHAQAQDAAEWLQVKATKKPSWVVTSDLPRHVQTAQSIASINGIPLMRPMLELRAMAKDESPDSFVKRTKKAFDSILPVSRIKGIPVIVLSRSTVAWLLEAYGGVRQRINYNDLGLLHAGGIGIIDTKKGFTGVYKTLTENSDNSLLPADGTHVAGFVTATVNKPPRECGNCQWMDENYCVNPIVTADDELGVMFGKKRNDKNFWIVDEDDCCDNFQNRPKGALKVKNIPHLVKGGKR